MSKPTVNPFWTCLFADCGLRNFAPPLSAHPICLGCERVHFRGLCKVRTRPCEVCTTWITQRMAKATAERKTFDESPEGKAHQEEMKRIVDLIRQEHRREGPHEGPPEPPPTPRRRKPWRGPPGTEPIVLQYAAPKKRPKMHIPLASLRQRNEPE